MGEKNNVYNKRNISFAIKHKYYLLFAIIVLIGFQQFPVLRIGGSFKIYELLSILLLLKFVTIKPKTFLMIVVWTLFVFSPVLSLLNAYLFQSIPYDFFIRYPEALHSFKFNNPFFSLLQLLYMIFNYSVFSQIYYNNQIFDNFEKLKKYVVIVGTFIAIYSIIACFTVDIITFLPSFIQNKSVYDFRSSGLSQEPSFYVLYQTRIVLFACYSRSSFSNKKWFFIIVINIFSLVLTFSTALLALLGILLFIPFVFKFSFKYRIFVLLILIVVCVAGYFMLVHSDMYKLFEMFFINKAQNFFITPDHTLDSGSFRNYTGRIGLEIFKENPLCGVGVGNSVYYMHIYENKMGIVEFGEVLSLGIFPQNLYSCVLAEQGLLGGVALFLFIFCVFRVLWKNRNSSPYGKMFFIGGIFNISVMFSVAVVYSLFIWLFLAISMGYYRYSKNKKLLEN